MSEAEPIDRLDLTIMMGGEGGASKRKPFWIGNEKCHVPACARCFKSWPEIKHFLISGKLTMCAPCWKLALEVKAPLRGGDEG